MGSILGGETKIPHACRMMQQKKKKKKERNIIPSSLMESLLDRELSWLTHVTCM